METIKLSAKVTTEIEREVTLPFFSKSSSSCYYKVITKDYQVAVSIYMENCCNIWKGDCFLGLALQGQQITEEEFNEFYNKVISML